MSSTDIDKVTKKTLGLSLSLGAMVAQRASSTRCNELPLGSSSIANEACKQLAVEGSGGCSLGMLHRQSRRREKGVGATLPAAHCRPSNPSIHHTNRRPFLFLGSCQCIPLYCLP